MRLITLILACILLQTSANACSCAPASNCWKLTNDGSVFVGTAITAVRTGDSVAVEFSVSEGLGQLKGVGTVTVRTEGQSTACGYPFRKGVRYFVTARTRGSELWTSSCSLTQPAVTAAGLIRQFRAAGEGKPIAQIFGFIGTEPYPGVSPLSRLEAKPFGSVAVFAVSATGRFGTSSESDGSFQFMGLSPGSYHLTAELPNGFFIWFQEGILGQTYTVGSDTSCQANFPLYPEGDPFAVNQRR